MANAPVIVASEVIIPDEVESQYTSLSAKRRQSQTSDLSNKRPRLSQNEHIKRESDVDSTSAPPRVSSERPASRQVDERKRGKRLFGALLGTLAQSSSSTANKRRVDIEKKQREKLKQQTDEYDEIKKQKLDALMEVRWREQKNYEKQSMHIRHSNLLASAQFLQTKAEPKLYYKPWEHLPGGEAQIKSQIEDAEAMIEEETAEFEITREKSMAHEAEVQNGSTTHQETVDPTADDLATNEHLADTDTNANAKSEFSDKDINITQVGPGKETDINVKSEFPNDDTKYSQGGLVARRSSADDSEEVIVEGVEDTVIY